MHILTATKYPKTSLKDGIVLITGGSQGIGYSCAKSCLNDGGNVILLSRSKVKLSDAVTSLKKLLPNDSKQKILTVSCDVTDYDKMDKEIKSCMDTNGFDKLDALFCNAGIEAVGTVFDTSIDKYRKIMDVNYFGVLNSIKVCLPYLIKNGQNGKNSKIVVTSSILGIMSMAYYSAYSASKFALRGLVESLASELASKNVFISIVYPPDVNTEMLKREKSIKIPQAIKDISEDSGMVEPDVVGNDMVNMVKNGVYMKSWTLDGWMLSNLTVGFSIVNGYINSIVQVLFLGILRIIGMYYTSNIYNICVKALKTA